jgi:hypothetical protein
MTYLAVSGNRVHLRELLCITARVIVVVGGRALTASRLASTAALPSVAKSVFAKIGICELN